MMYRKYLLLFVTFAISSALNCETEELTYTIKEINGVKVVNNLAPKWGDKPKIRLEFVRQIGDLSGEDENFLFFRPSDILLDKNNMMYILDSGNSRIQKFDYEGNFLSTIGNKGQGPGEFLLPVNLELGTDGNLYVNDIRNANISVFTPDGKFVKTIKKLELSPLQIKLLQSGEIALFDLKFLSPENSDKGNMLRVIDKNGNTLRKFGKRKSYDEPDLKVEGNAAYLTADKMDNIYLTYHMQNRIDKYSADGKYKFKIQRALPYKEHERLVMTNVMLDNGETMEQPMVNNFSSAIQIDNKERIWVGAFKRQPTVKEIIDMRENYKLSLNRDIFMIEIFDSNGVLLSTVANEHFTRGSGLKIYDDKLFIIDRTSQMAIFEYLIIEQ